MLLALVFRGVAFEFRFRQPEIAWFWSHGVCAGSAIAAFAQGAVLGGIHEGFPYPMEVINIQCVVAQSRGAEAEAEKLQFLLRHRLRMDR